MRTDCKDMMAVEDDPMIPVELNEDFVHNKAKSFRVSSLFIYTALPQWTSSPHLGGWLALTQYVSRSPELRLRRWADYKSPYAQLRTSDIKLHKFQYMMWWAKDISFVCPMSQVDRGPRNRLGLASSTTFQVAGFDIARETNPQIVEVWWES